MIAALAGLPPAPDPDLLPGEIYVSERRFQTCRDDRWKGYRHRETGRFLLVDLENDPKELRDVADRHPRAAVAVQSRIDELERALGVLDASEVAEISEADRGRLRALGYDGGAADDDRSASEIERP